MSVQQPLLEAWYAALRSRVGYCLITDNRPLFIQRLYKARAEANDPALDALSITTSPTSDQEVWIVHKVVKVDAEESPGTPSVPPDQAV